MKDKFEMLNDTVIDFNDYQNYKLNDLEKKQMKKSIRSKLRKKISTNKKVAIIASLAVLLYCGTNVNPGVLADVPIIGNIIEDYVNSKGKSLEDYKTVIGKTVYDNEIGVKLNEVILDEEQLIISSTFHSTNKKLQENNYPQTDAFINGREVSGCGSASIKKIDDYTCTYFSRVDVKDLSLKRKLNVEINYNFKYSLKPIKGNWKFEFTASGDKLLAKMKTIEINKSFKLENGQEIKVENLNLTPVSTKLNYKILNGKKYDVQFTMYDNNKKAYDFKSARTLSKNSYNRFVALDENVKSIKLIPYVISGEEGENKTDYHKVLDNEAIEVNIK